MAKLRTLALPQVLESAGLLAGHSMGGHGVWVTAASNPDFFSCLSAGSSWIKKEEYGQANAFFGLDVQNSFVDSGEIIINYYDKLSFFHRL
jgi:S-formylglutathione hydrolase FrmB